MHHPSGICRAQELGRGTATHDGAAIAHATLEHLATRTPALCIFITHHPAVAALADTHPDKVRLAHMACLPAGGAAGAAGAAAEVHMQPLFRLAPGAGPGAFALRVGAVAGLPPELLAVAAAQAERLHEQQRRRHAARQLQLAGEVAVQVGVGVRSLAALQQRVRASLSCVE